MDFSRSLTARLAVLTEALASGGDDLRTMLTVLVDDLSAGISSFAGLSITVPVDGEPVTLTAMNSSTAAASMLLPLRAGTGAGHVVFYAENPGAFVDLAADAQFALGPGWGVVVDGHLPPPNALAAQRGLDAVTDRSTVNQGLGFLIGQGYPPERAHVELARRASAAGVSLLQIARQILRGAHRPDPDAQDEEEGADPDEMAG